MDWLDLLLGVMFSGTGGSPSTRSPTNTPGQSTWRAVVDLAMSYESQCHGNDSDYVEGRWDGTIKAGVNTDYINPLLVYFDYHTRS